MSDLPLFFIPVKGELAALSAAFCWAIASAVYGQVGQNIPPLILNLLKGTIAIGLLLLTILLTGNFLPDINPLALSLLLLSGVVGIGLGDTAYFAALKSLGARKALLLESLAPPLAALLGLVCLGERLSAIAWCGIFLTVLGVAWVVAERVADGGGQLKWQGISFGVLAAFAQATGAVLSRAALTQTTVSPLWSTLLRLSAAVVAILLWLCLKRQEVGMVRPPQFSRQAWSAIAFATFLGTYLGIWLQQTALKFTAAGIAQALNATSPLFVLPIAIFMGDRVSPRAVLGVLIALIGIALLFGLR